MPESADWARAFAKQAWSDLMAYKHLTEHPDLPECHQLQFLQMACEKMCKAHLLARNTTLREEDLRKHTVIAKHLPAILEERLRLHGMKREQIRFLVNRFRHLSGEIEVLTPAADRAGRRKDNTEYPWETNGRVVAPAEHAFTNIDLKSQLGPQFLNWLRKAVESLKTECGQ